MARDHAAKSNHPSQKLFVGQERGTVARGVPIMTDRISRLIMRVFYQWRYFTGKTPWDTNVTPPEVVEWVEHEDAPRGRALDLGCGTGTNALYLAQHGFEVVGVDFVSRAIATARRKAQAQ